MAQDADRQIRRILGWVTLGAGLLMTTFWLLYFSAAADLGQHHPLFHEFELAFPLADGVLAVMLFTASRCLLAGRPSGPFWLVAAASMSLYLGILDLTFYGRQGLYVPLTGSALIALAGNAICIGGGALGLGLGWRLWRTA
jgi:hypothetical protein